MKQIQLIILFIILHYVYCNLYILGKPEQAIITAIKDYYDCDLILLFGSDLNKKDSDWDQKVVIVKNNIKIQNIKEFNEAEKPLIVFFSDSERNKFQLIATTLYTSKSIFIFFVHDELKLDDFFSNVHLPRDYKFIISQKSELNSNQETVWRIRLNEKNKIKKSLFGTWSQATGIESFGVLKNKSSHVLRAGIINNPIPANSTGFIRGVQWYTFIQKIQTTLENYTNLKFTYTPVLKVGIKENGSWTGGMGMLTNHSIDILMTLANSKKTEDVDFAFPLIKSIIAMYMRKPDDDFRWNGYFVPFNITVWCVIILVMIVESIILTFFEYYQKIDVIRRLKKRSIKLPIKYGESIFKIYGALCGQNLSSSRFVPMRILQVVVHVTALLFLTFYSAILLSILTTTEIKLPIGRLEDLMKNSPYKLGTIRGEIWNFFENNENKFMRQIFHSHIKTQNPIPKSLDEGHAHMCRDDKYAFVSYDFLVNSYSFSNCVLLMIEPVTETQFTFVLQHHSPYLKKINHYFLKLYENGLLKKYRRDHFIMPPKAEKSWVPISKFQILPILCILLSSMLFSIILLVLEILIHQILEKRRNKSGFSVRKHWFSPLSSSSL